MRQFRSLAFTCAVAMSVLGACGASSGSDQSAPAATASAGVTTTAPTTTTATASADSADDNTTDHDDPADYTWNESDVVTVALNGASASAGASSVKVSGSTVTIGAARTYRLTGSLTNGQIVVDTDDDGVVRLILNGVDIKSASTSPISVTDATKVVVILADGTQNRLTDAATYTFADASTDEPNAALFSTADLTIAGEGSLTVKGNFNDAIASKDGLIIADGTIVVDAKDDGIRGKDYLVVKGGTITVRATGDALKSDNEEDTGVGYVTIAAGTLDLTSGGDAIQAATDVAVKGGTIKIKAGGGSSATVAQDASAKGIKGTAGVTISGGALTIDAADDAINSNDNVTISDASIAITTGDDGVHADATLVVNSGTIDITKSYEGIESAAITIAGGAITIVSSDDGVNAAGGVDGSGTQQPNGGRDSFAQGGNNTLTVTGGRTLVTANGDGIDVNGSWTMTGGTVIVNGPTANNNGALDYDGTFELSGGVVMAAGSSGMAQSPSSSSTQPTVAIKFNAAQPAGTLVRIQTSSGEEIATFTPSKSYQSVVVSTPKLTNGSSYDVIVGGTKVATATATTTNASTGGMGTPGGR